jgi:hypothetical protein
LVLLQAGGSDQDSLEIVWWYGRSVMEEAIDLLILSNGPGELLTWVKPVVAALRRRFGDDRAQLRISVVLSPCSNASGGEADLARRYREVDRVQGAEAFFPFLLFGKTVENWDWRRRGVVIFLGGDQVFPLVIGKRLGYKTVLYTEWDALWPRFADRYGVTRQEIVGKAPAKFAKKFAVVGDLMVEAGAQAQAAPLTVERIGILPGSKAAKLAQGLPLFLEVADRMSMGRSGLEFVIPVAPTLGLESLADYGDGAKNPVVALVGGRTCRLVRSDQGNYLETAGGNRVVLVEPEPGESYRVLSGCQLCITTVGANTAELGALAVPMVVLIPTQQLDAMRAWNGLPGLLANLPGVGTIIAKGINLYMVRRLGLLAWPNIWAGRQIVPELMGRLVAQEVADRLVDYLENPEKLETMRREMRAVSGPPGASDRLVDLVAEVLN